MKILPIIQNTNKNIANTSKRFKKAYSTGFNNANNYSKQHNHGKLKRAYGISKSVT